MLAKKKKRQHHSIHSTLTSASSSTSSSALLAASSLLLLLLLVDAAAADTLLLLLLLLPLALLLLLVVVVVIPAATATSAAAAPPLSAAASSSSSLDLDRARALEKRHGFFVTWSTGTNYAAEEGRKREGGSLKKVERKKEEKEESENDGHRTQKTRKKYSKSCFPRESHLQSSTAMSEAFSGWTIKQLSVRDVEKRGEKREARKKRPHVMRGICSSTSEKKKKRKKKTRPFHLLSLAHIRSSRPLPSRTPTKQEYVRDVGGNPDACDTKEELIELAARLAVAAEAAALGNGSGGGGGGGGGGGNTASASASASAASPAPSSAYPEIEYSEQPRREEGQQTATTATTGNPFAPSSSSVPASMPPANALSGPRRRAVLVGCNYAATPSASLQGCINDANCLRHLLVSRFGFLDENIVLLLVRIERESSFFFFRSSFRLPFSSLTSCFSRKKNEIKNFKNHFFPKDTSPYPSQWPTRANILWHASNLSSGARAGDSLFFSFSGHGAQVPDQSGVSFFPISFFPLLILLRISSTAHPHSLSLSLYPLSLCVPTLSNPQDEADGLSETICPCDFPDSGGGSGGGMILDDELNLALVRPLPSGAKLHSLLDCCHSGSTLNLEFRCKAREGPIYWKQEYEYQPRTYKGSAGGLVVGISASRDKQVAADTSQLAAGGSHTGAATFTFIQSIEAYGTSLSYEALLRNVSCVFLYKYFFHFFSTSFFSPPFFHSPLSLSFLLSVSFSLRTLFFLFYSQTTKNR